MGYLTQHRCVIIGPRASLTIEHAKGIVLFSVNHVYTENEIKINNVSCIGSIRLFFRPGVSFPFDE